jgi:hypothetical protein
MKNNIKPTRRDFIKVLLASIGGFLASCLPQAQETEAPPTDTPTTEPALTETSETEESPEPAETPTETPTKAPSCLQLLSPEDGATLGAIGKVIFSWESMDGAEKYEIEFSLPTGQPVTFEAIETNHTRYLESFPISGDFTWKVTALNAKGDVICVSESFTFTKLAPAQKQGDGGDEGGNTNDGINIQNIVVD